MSPTDSETDQEKAKAAAEAARAQRFSQLKTAWEGQRERTRPANRPLVEEALRGFYSSVGFLGPLRGIVWAESFTAFAGAVQAVRKDYCWLLLHQQLGRQRPDQEHLIGNLFLDFLRGPEIVAGYRVVDSYDLDEMEEEELEGLIEEGDLIEEGRWLQSFSVPHSQLLPSIYAPEYWADVEIRHEEGTLRTVNPQCWALRALRECVSFFPGPGVAVCADFPEEIHVETDPGHSGQFLRWRFRNGETLHHSTWGALTGFREWDELRNWPLLPTKTILEQRDPFLGPLIDRIGIERVIEGAPIRTVVELENQEIRHRLIDAMNPADFVVECQGSGFTVRTTEKDAFGTLHRVELPGQEDYQCILVENSTPEPDGSYRRYALRVPPDVRTPKEAVAWTFGLTESEYNPSQQT